MELSEEEVRDMLQNDDDYPRYQWINHRIQECVLELISYQEDFNLEETELRSELSLGIGHLIKALSMIKPRKWHGQEMQSLRGKVHANFQ